MQGVSEVPTGGLIRRRFDVSPLLRFFLLTIASQVFLVINQVALLPLQIRVWGPVGTAEWFVVLATGNIASIADLGLRNSGHAELLSSVKSANSEAAKEFRRTWALARGLVLIVTIVLLGTQAVSAVRFGAPFAPWVVAVTIALSLDTIFIVRAQWFDSLGRFNLVESLFLATLATRVCASALALVFLGAAPSTLGWIWLGTAVAATVGQAVLLRSPSSLSLLAGGFRSVPFRSLGVVRFVIAEPASNWARLSLPVMVFAGIASPVFITTYVAFRAIFGLARQLNSQISRYASVRYVNVVDENRSLADRYVTFALLLSAFVGSGVAAATIADHGRLVSKWLHVSDRGATAWIALSFAFGGTALGYQAIAGVMIRSGHIKSVAARQYAYLAASAATTIVACIVGSPELYLFLLALQEIFIAALFAPALGARESCACSRPRRWPLQRIRCFFAYRRVRSRRCVYVIFTDVGPCQHRLRGSSLRC